ncbi:MAG: hypothetical protein LH619_13845 [Chitinophagaceae bacterium]|nr:hypothetical protein [Chitinophagaceae bacterium]
MRIFATGRTAYTLVNKDGSFAGSLIYTDNSLSEASLKCGEYIFTVGKQEGSWITAYSQDEKKIATIKVSLGGTVVLNINEKHYTFKKPLYWKLRFVVLNADKKEIPELLPLVNWSRKCYDFVLQLNDELICESDSFVILQALQSAVWSMAMMNGTLVATVGCIT